MPEFSAWLRPFIVHKVMEKLDWMFLAVYAVVYVVLAAPTVIHLVKSIVPLLQPRARRLLEWRSWGF